MRTMRHVAASLLVSAVTVSIGCRGLPATPNSEATMLSIESPADTALSMQAERIGSGRPLVLVGGGLTGSASWARHAERLAATRDVARLQLLSVEYGLEDRPLPDGYSVHTESGALAAAIDHLQWDQPVDLVAWSYGAVVTLDFALDHPGRVRSLTLIEPPAFWVLPDHGRELPDVRELEALLPDVDGDVPVETLARFLRSATLVPPGTSPQSLPQWESWVLHRRSLRNGGAVFQHSDDVARLRAFRAPVLLVTGQGTSPSLRVVHDTLAANLPNARTLELPGGHAPQLASMDEFLAALKSFQDGVSPPSQGRRRTVTSPDGTDIAFWQLGSGPPLLLVHGATADHTTTWRFVLPELAGRFTVLAMDRRGRGGSGDGEGYDIAGEAEDVAAVIDAIDEPVNVLGHSYGALIALEASRLTTNLDRLILYEGVPMRGQDLYAHGVIEHLESLLERGDLAGLLTAMYSELVEMPPEEIELLRSNRDAWATRQRNAHTLPRELRTEASYVFQPERFRGMNAPTLLLVGGDSPSREMANAQGVASGLPDARVAILPGQQHAAMYTAPDLFVAEISRFLDPEETRAARFDTATTMLE